MENPNNAFRTQKNFELADAILKQFGDLTPEARNRVMKALHKTSEEKQLQESTKLVKSGDELVNEYRGKRLIFDGLSTGLPTLDRYLLGLKGGDVVVVGAYTGLGKSTFLLNMALHLRTKGINSAMFALEDSEYEVGTRAAFLVAGKSEYQMNHSGEMFLFGKEGVPLLYKNKFSFIPAVEAMTAAKDVKVVFLDMLNDILDPISDKDADDFMVELKYLADRLNIVLVITARLREPSGLSEKTRAKEKIYPSEDAIYGRSMIKFLATKIITMSFAPTHEYQPATGFGSPEARYVAVHVMKNRLGRTTKNLGGAAIAKLTRGESYMRLEDIGFETFGGTENA